MPAAPARPPARAAVAATDAGPAPRPASERAALVVGVANGIGGAVAAARARRGGGVRALADAGGGGPAVAADRVPPGAERPDWTWAPGDAMDPAAAIAAAAGVRVIVYAVDPPPGRDAERLVLATLDHTIRAARASGARVLVAGTLDGYGPHDLGPGRAAVVHDDAPQHPATRAGRLRAEVEQQLEMAAAPALGRGRVRSLVVRMGDVFGPRAGRSWFSRALVRPGRPVTRVTYPGAPGVGHAWAYLPDVAEAFARLAERESALGPFDRLHFAGHWDADGTEMVAAIARAAGADALPVRRPPWALVRLAAPFRAEARELLAVRHLWSTAVWPDNTRLASVLGAEPHTPLDAAVAATLLDLGCLPAGAPAGPPAGPSAARFSPRVGRHMFTSPFDRLPHSP